MGVAIARPRRQHDLRLAGREVGGARRPALHALLSYAAVMLCCHALLSCARRLTLSMRLGMRLDLRLGMRHIPRLRLRIHRVQAWAAAHPGSPLP